MICLPETTLGEHCVIAPSPRETYLPKMSRVEEIKAQIDALTWEERCELNAMLQNWPEDAWDRAMAADGKFDALMQEAAREYQAGECRDWPRA